MRPPKTMAGSVCIWLSILLSGVGACFNFVGASERLSRTGTARRKRTLGCVDWSGKHTWCVRQVFPSKVYIDLNRRDSRI
jgi:hypothetical protein